jgi:hypothetical protein
MKASPGLQEQYTARKCFLNGWKMLFMKREGFQNKEIRFTELPELLKSKNPMGTKNLLDSTLESQNIESLKFNESKALNLILPSRFSIKKQTILEHFLRKSLLDLPGSNLEVNSLPKQVVLDTQAAL